MKRNIITLIAAVSVTLSMETAAEGLLEIYQLSKQNDSGLKAAESIFNAEKEAVNISRGSLFPEITLSGSLGYAKTQDDSSTDTTTESNSVELGLNYPIYSSALGYAVDIVKLDYEGAKADYSNAEEDLTYETLEAYFDLLTQESNLKIANSQAAAISSQLQKVKKQFEVGQVAITDVHTSQAEYDSNLVDILNAEANVTNAQETLRQLTGKLITNIPDLAIDYPITMDNVKAASYYVEIAKHQNKNIKALKLDYESASTNINLQKASGRSPTLSLSGSIKVSDSEATPASNNDGSTTTSNIALTLSIPLYEGGAINASVRQAVANAEAVRESLNDKLQDTELAVRKQYRLLQSTVAQTSAQKQLITSFSSLLKATEAGYNAGTRNVVDLLDAQSDLFDAQGVLEQLRYQFVLQRLSLLEYAGELNEEEVKKLDAWLVL